MAVTAVRLPPLRPASPEPDMDWYLSVSHKRGVTPRCPYASTERCPRYFESLSLLGDVGRATKISLDEDKRLQDRWEKSDLWPKTREAATSISGGSIFSNFCPEVAHDRFGFFASGFAEHADEIDRDVTHQRLAEQGGRSWEWVWAYVQPLHFTECPLYSPLHHSPDRAKAEQKELLTLKPGIWGLSFDLKEGGRRLRLLWRKWFARGATP